MLLAFLAPPEVLSLNLSLLAFTRLVTLSCLWVYSLPQPCLNPASILPRPCLNPASTNSSCCWLNGDVTWKKVVPDEFCLLTGSSRPGLRPVVFLYRWGMGMTKLNGEELCTFRRLFCRFLLLPLSDVGRASCAFSVVVLVKLAAPWCA